MPTKITIMAEVKARVGSASYTSWNIGLAHDAEIQRKYLHETEGQDVSRWTCWSAESLSDALRIEDYFVERGMKKCGTGGELSTPHTVCLYIF